MTKEAFFYRLGYQLTTLDNLYTLPYLHYFHYISSFFYLFLSSILLCRILLFLPDPVIPELLDLLSKAVASSVTRILAKPVISS